MELVRFDLQKRVNPEIAGVQYQQGTLEGYEVREYLLEKYHRHCIYCGATGVPLNIDHVVPVALGGSCRITNLVTACMPHGKKAGAYVGRVAVRTSGRFNIQMGATVLQSIGSQHCIVIQRGDGYAYTQHALPPRPEGAGFPCGEIR